MFHNLPGTRSQRWALLNTFVAYWYGPLGELDGYKAADLDLAEHRLGIRLPAALREWYSLAGKRADIWSRQDEFLAPNQLRIRRNTLVFFVENQGNVEWGLDISQSYLEDPPVMVLGDDFDTSRSIESDSVTAFALAMLVFSVKWGDVARWWANGASTEQSVSLVEAHYPRLPLDDWHWPSYPTRFYGTHEIIIETNGPLEDAWLWISARTESSYQTARQLLAPAGVDWQAWAED